MNARANSQWIGQVQRLLREGYGVEDIALRLGCDVEDVRREVKILRDMGIIKEIVR